MRNCKTIILIAFMSLLFESNQLHGQTWDTYTSVSPKGINAMTMSMNSHIWAVDNFMIYKFDGVKWTIDYVNYEVGTSIIADLNNQIWVTTEKGIWTNKNNKWQKISSQDFSFANDFFTSVKVDGQNRKWFGSKVGLFMYDGQNWTRYCKANSSIVSDDISEINIDNISRIWFTTVGSGVGFYDGSTFQSSLIPGVYNSSTLVDMAIDAGNTSWTLVYGKNVLYKYNGVSWDSLAFPYYNAKSIAFDGFSNIWIGSSQGLYKYDGSTWKFYDSTDTKRAISFYKSKNLFTDIDNNVWFVNGNNQSLFCKTAASWLYYDTIPNAIIDAYYSDILQDNSNKTYMVGNAGVSTLNNNQISIKYEYNFNLNNCSFLINPGEYAVGSQNDRTYTTADFINKSMHGTLTGVLSIWKDTSGTIWQCNNNFMEKLFDTSFAPIPIILNAPNNLFKTVKVDKDNNFWFANYQNGVFKYDGTNWTVYNEANTGFKINGTTSLAIDSNNIVWIATNRNGLYSFDGAYWDSYTSSNSGLIEDSLFCVEVDKYNRIWIGLLDKGMMRFDGQQQWIYFNKDNSPLLDNHVIHINFDYSKDFVWISNAVSCQRFALESLPTGIFISTEDETKELIVYPNPTSGKFQIKASPALQRREKVLYNSVGQKVFSTKENEIDVSHLPNGIYYLKCENQVKKVIVE